MGKFGDLTGADITPKSVYLNRRQILRAMGIAGAAVLGGESVLPFRVPSSGVKAGTKLKSR